MILNHILKSWFLICTLLMANICCASEACRQREFDVQGKAFKPFHQQLISSSVFKSFLDDRTHGEFAGLDSWAWICFKANGSPQYIDVVTAFEASNGPLVWTLDYCTVRSYFNDSEIFLVEKLSCANPMDY